MYETVKALRPCLKAQRPPHFAEAVAV